MDNIKKYFDFHFKKATPIIVEDDAAPDSMDQFSREFKEHTGLDYKEFRTDFELRILEDSGFSSFTYRDGWMVTSSADDPYLKLYKVE